MKNTSNLPPNAITTPDYWEDAWAHTDVPDAIDPHNDTPENHYYQQMHTLFTRALGAHCLPGARLIEIGCGGSRWLPYFHRAFGYDVSGIDYTVAGVLLSQAILDKAGVSGRIVQGDLFEPPTDWIGRFDVVVSFGLVEHFENTSQAVSACARYLRPGGRMITGVPTLRGPYGLAIRLLRPAVYRKHIPQSRETLAQAHTDAGLNVTHSDYVLGLPGIISAPVNPGLLGRMAFAASRLNWKLEQSGWGVPPNRFTSPYALCVATKPGDTQA
jgi:2-polyprenyl-3-methyl-5-hydroxy-6-metoxy-1,4-benzoquinol methylase